MREDWIKCHTSICRGKWRGVSRAARFVLLELAMLTKPTDGVLELPHGQPDHVEAIVDLLAGSSRKERREVREAVRELVKLDSLQVKTDLNVVAVANFSRWNPPPSGKERTKAYRERERLRKVAAGGDVTPVTGGDALEESRGEEIPPRPPEEKPKRRRRSPTSPIPDDWRPTDEHRERCREHDLNCDREAEKFRSHALSVDRRQARWNASFTSWILKALDMREERAPEQTTTTAWTPEIGAAWRRKHGLS